MTRISQEIIDAQPEPPRPNRRADTNWLKNNWLGVATMAVWLVTQLAGGGAWISGRESKEQDLTLQVEQLRHELQQTQATFVRQDVFQAVMQRIDEKLTSIDAKVSKR